MNVSKEGLEENRPRERVRGSKPTPKATRENKNIQISEDYLVYVRAEELRMYIWGKLVW